jgi:hypothetical protein
MAPVPDTIGLKVCSYQPRMQQKPADLPKQPQTQKPRKQYPRKLCLYSADAKGEGTLLDPESSHEDLDIDTSE